MLPHPFVSAPMDVFIHPSSIPSLRISRPPRFHAESFALFIVTTLARFYRYYPGSVLPLQSFRLSLIDLCSFSHPPASTSNPVKNARQVKVPIRLSIKIYLIQPCCLSTLHCLDPSKFPCPLVATCNRFDTCSFLLSRPPLASTPHCFYIPLLLPPCINSTHPGFLSC